MGPIAVPTSPTGGHPGYEHSETDDLSDHTDAESHAKSAANGQVGIAAVARQTRP